MNTKKSKFLTILFSFIPGAGHMYLGLMRQGLQFMSLFFFSIFIASWLNIEIFLMVTPIIWFYSFFDVLNKISTEDPIEDHDIWLNWGGNWSIDKHKWLGYGLITIGIIMIVDKILFPMFSIYLSFRMRQYIKTAAVGIAFILGGVKLLVGNQTKKGDNQECDSGE